MLKSSNFWFFCILSSNFWLVPLVGDGDGTELFSDGFLALTVLAAVALQALVHRRFRIWAIAAGCVIVGAIALEELLPNAAFIESATFAACFAAATVLYFTIMTRSLDQVTFDTIFAAACTFMLIGMFFAFVFGLVLEADATALSSTTGPMSRLDLLYYSFATLTTLGAPDYAPVSDLAKMLTVFEATMGLFYIALLVGAIVGAFSAGIVSRRGTTR